MSCKFRILYFCVIILMTVNLPATLRTPLRQYCHFFQVHPLQEKGGEKCGEIKYPSLRLHDKVQMKNLYRFFYVYFFKYIF